MLPSQYVTPTDLLQAPLGLSLRGIPGAGTTGPAGVSGVQNWEQLTQICYRLSALADNYCDQVLGATAETLTVWQGRQQCWIDQNGYLLVQAPKFPVVSVSSFQYGFPALGGVSYTSAVATDVSIQGDRANRLVYPGSFSARGNPPLQVLIGYVAGFPGALLTGSAPITAGATSLPLADRTGFVAGQVIQILDQGNTERVVVASSYAAATGAGNLTLAAATAFTHTPVPRPATAPAQPYDILVTAMPPDIQQACLAIGKCVVDKRGVTALTMGRAGAVKAPPSGKTADPYEVVPPDAALILDSYRRTI